MLSGCADDSVPGGGGSGGGDNGSSPSDPSDTCCDGGWDPTTSGPTGTESGEASDMGADGTPFPDCFDDRECPDGAKCIDGFCVDDAGCIDVIEPPVCGDGQRTGPEECDGDAGCAADCSLSDGFAETYAVDDTRVSAIAASDDVVVAAGEGATDVFIVGLDSMLTELWSLSPGAAGATVRDAAVDDTGTSMVVGALDGSWWGVRVDAAGAQQWTLPTPRSGSAFGVAIDASGGAVVVGGADDEGAAYSYDADGAQIGSVSVEGTTELRGVTSVGADDFIAVGYAPTAAWIGRVTAGAVTWDEFVAFPASGNEVLYDVALGPNGASVIAVGAADGGPWVRHYSMTGKLTEEHLCVGRVLGRFESVAAFGFDVVVAGSWRADEADADHAWLANVGADVSWSRSASLTAGTTEAAATGVGRGFRFYGSGFGVSGDSVSGWVRSFSP